MQHRFVRQSAFFIAVVMIISLCLVEVTPQTRKKRRSRRIRRPVITNPAIAPAATNRNSAVSEDKIVSTADENSAATDQPADADARKAGSRKRSLPDQEQMQETITTLSSQVMKLTDKLSQMQDEQRSLLDMERLTRAEQRAETLRAQLRDVQAKQAELQAKLDETEYALKPENIDRVVSMYGTTHPEEARDSRRRQLENERTRTQAQLNQLDISRSRLESAIATADAEVDLLHQRLDKANSSQVQAAGANTASESNPPPPEPPPAKNPYPPE
jgi:chromosome segregation ATPase